jgi:hypothetical protein
MKKQSDKFDMQSASRQHEGGSLRKDRYGVEIKRKSLMRRGTGQKKKKRHRVTFVDIVESAPIASVFEVESYKKYYLSPE